MEEIIVVIEIHWMMGIKAKERLLIWLRVNNLLSGGQQHSPGSFLAQHAAYADVMLQI